MPRSSAKGNSRADFTLPFRRPHSLARILSIERTFAILPFSYSSPLLQKIIKVKGPRKHLQLSPFLRTSLSPKQSAYFLRHTHRQPPYFSFKRIKYWISAILIASSFTLEQVKT
ncbi:hypothetical protein FCM35_KLT04462 [Carex littledalei]|uniref:Uncharacterized protein n=1 Tax=Carex littledalei TaxID=544730 RepID=A0A833VQD8_9POAL|nr:hypothetical protein FCM35_KLT04462 [Carex littledalei]